MIRVISNRFQTAHVDDWTTEFSIGAVDVRPWCQLHLIKAFHTKTYQDIYVR